MKLGLFTLVCLGAGLAQAHGAATVGSPAPAVEPSEWLNSKTPLTWKELQGRVILVERWATW